MIKLNLGSGNSYFGEDWEHIDSIELPHIKQHDITKLLFKDNSVDLIYSSHTLEYFDREEVLPVLQEWNRVLKLNGKIYLSVPDFKAMSELYLNEGVPLHKFLGPLYGKMDSNGKTIFHKTVWDYASLGEYLRISGFRRIDTWDEKTSYFGHEIIKVPFGTSDDCSHAKINGKLISLNVCAEKNNYEGVKK
jgi:predicted SAM-dependent methyltransferase